MFKLRSALLLAALAALAAGDATSLSAQADPSQCWLRRATPETAAERPSPLGVVAVTFGEQTAQLCYGRPSANDRVVMGELVPFGPFWRTGANEATAIHLPFAAEIGGVSVPAGSYSLYSAPGADEWTFYLNSNVERWGIPINDEVRASDVGSFVRESTQIEEMVETFTIRWESHGAMMGHLVIEWEHTRVEIPIHMAGMNHG